MCHLIRFALETRYFRRIGAMRKGCSPMWKTGTAASAVSWNQRGKKSRKVTSAGCTARSELVLPRNSKQAKAVATTGSHSNQSGPSWTSALNLDCGRRQRASMTS